MNEIKKLRLETLIDYLLIIWSVLSLITWVINRSNVADSELFNRMLVVCVYFAVRLVLKKSNKTVDRIILIALLLLYLCELLWGYLQLFELVRTNDQYNLTVGSFENTSPYGGFISLCVAILTVYYLQNKEKKINVVFIIAAIPGFILLPSIRSRAAVLALIVSLLVYYAISHKKLFRKYIPYVLVALISIGVAAYFYKKPSAQGRFLMSKICTQALFDSGITGSGLGSFSGVYGNQQYRYFYNKMEGSLDESLLSENERLVADCPTESFNDYLRVGIESGIISMVLYLVIIGCSLYWGIKNRSIWAFGLIVYSVYALFFSPSRLLLFNIIFPIILSMCISSEHNEDKNTSYHQIPAFLLSFVLLLLMTPSIKNYTRSISIWRERTGKQYSFEKYDKVIAGCDTLQTSLYSFSPFMFAYGRTLHLMGDYDKSDSILMIGSKTSSDPMFWNVMGNNSLAKGNYREAEERYKHAFIMVPNRLYPLYLLAKLYYTEGDTIRFTEMANKIYNFIPKVESILTDNMRTEIKELELLLSD